MVSLSKFAERQLLVIKTRNKPAKKVHHTQPSFRLWERTWASRTGSQFLPGLQVSKGEQQTIDLHISSVHRHGSYNFRQTNFKDFSSLFQRQITVSRTKIFFNPLLNTLANLRTTTTTLSTTTGSELRNTAQARPVNFVVVVSSTTANKVESRRPAIHKPWQV